LYDAAKAVGGYAGIFIVSVLGNAIPFISVPYLAVVYFYSMKIAEASPLLVGVVSGLGGAVGKLAVYAVGRGSRVFLKKETRDRYERIGKLLRSYGALSPY
jgi:membrane protein DedA with SNARE-associated domain